MRGLERPERIVRLDAPALPVVALPVRASLERAGNLPHPSTTLIGRHDELDRLVDMVGRHRLVTVTGPGGAGKTRLALAAADAVADQFPDGTWFVELGELLDAADVPSAVATTLALQPAHGTEGVTSTVAALAGQHALLLLDNCEHLIDGVIQFVSAIERCDRITVLATSREALGLSHEVRLNLQPLGVDGGTSDAVRLFCERAAGVLGGFEPSAADLAVIDEVCRRLDGLPLAIELATARLSTMNVEELRSRLDDRFELLARPRGINARHQSLRATVAWSYDLLAEVEQSLFDQLSVFGADFGPGAARAVGGDATVPIEDLLMSLVDKSLLTTTRGPLGTRFRQLETLRQYGEARLDAGGGVSSAMRRQLDYYVAWTESADAGIKGPDELHWHHGFTVEWPNIRNAFRWACHVDDGDAASRLVSATLWWATSRMRLEAEQWCDLVLGLPSASDHDLRPVVSGASPSSRTCATTPRASDGRSTSRAPKRSGWDRRGAVGAGRRPQQLERRTGCRPRRRVRAAPPSRGRRRRDLAAEGLTRRSAHPRHIDPWRDTVARRGSRLHRPHQADRRTGRDVRAAERRRRRTRLAGHRAEGLRARRGADAPRGCARPVRAARRRGELQHDALRVGIPLHATRTATRRVALVRTTIPDHIRVGAWHEVYPALAHTAQAFADLGRPRVAATILGRLGAGTSELNQNCHGFPALHEQLVAELGAADLTTLVDESRSRTLADIAQLVLETIDEIVEDPGPEV